MRQKSMECKDERKINEFLSTCHTGYLGLSDNGTPYVIPLNYVWWKGKIYFHGAAEGRKIDILKHHSGACFTVSEPYGTMADPVPAKTDTAYMSVMIFGNAEPVNDLNEATEAMQIMLNKYVPGYYPDSLPPAHVEKYRSSLGSKTMVFSIEPELLSAKLNQLVEEKTFYSGRKRAMDV